MSRIEVAYGICRAVKLIDHPAIWVCSSLCGHAYDRRGETLPRHHASVNTLSRPAHNNISGAKIQKPRCLVDQIR